MKRLISIAILLMAAASTALAVPVGQQFTYQGHLTQNGTPVNGPVDLQFSLWDAETGGNLIPLFGFQNMTVTVTNGAFTATLAGNLAFDTGEARWLQIAVCGDQACTSTTILTPRQPLTAVPYAMYAMKPWNRFNGNLYVDSSVKVGIGATPTQPLDVYGVGSFFRVDGVGDVHANGGNDSVFGIFNDGAASGGTSFVSQGQHRLFVRNDGRVGINTLSPGGTLDVRGPVRLGNSGELYAPGGYENLRIIRGVINSDGSAPSGCCFSVSHPVTGQYDITFAESFLSAPSVVASSSAVGALANVIFLSNQSIRVAIRNATNNTALNGGFHFIATGER